MSFAEGQGHGSRYSSRGFSPTKSCAEGTDFEARAIGLNLMVLWRAAESPKWSKRVSLRRKGPPQSRFLKRGECLCALGLGRFASEGQVLRLPQYRVVGFFRKGFVVECKAQTPTEASRFPRLLRECF